MVRFYIEPPKGEAKNAVDNWVQNHNEWTDDPKDHSLVETNTKLDGSGTTYLCGDYRFVQDGPADALLDDLADRLQSFQGGLWYRIGYHECDHDENNPTGCAWEQTRENGDVPADIPTLE
jgi:hypothetical protein